MFYVDISYLVNRNSESINYLINVVPIYFLLYGVIRRDIICKWNGGVKEKLFHIHFIFLNY